MTDKGFENWNAKFKDWDTECIDVNQKGRRTDGLNEEEEVVCCGFEWDEAEETERERYEGEESCTEVGMAELGGMELPWWWTRIYKNLLNI